MTLMRLAPESVRLRRMAKAYAAGELSEAEYRDARRAIIDTFPTVAVHDDDTRPRYLQDTRQDMDVTVRNAVGGTAASMVSAANPSAGVDGVGVDEMGGLPDRLFERLFERHGWWLIGALLLVAIAAPAALGAEPVMQVPPVAARNPDPVASPRLPVSRVVVEWGGDHADPIPGIELSTLQQAADEGLEQARLASAPGEHGFTPSELEEVGRLLQVFGAHDADATLDAADAADLRALIRDQKRRRGISVAQLEEVAEGVQTRLREAGYFLAVAYVPAQRVDDGLAHIEVLPGRLGDIVVEGGDAAPVTGAFAALLGEPLQIGDVASRMHALNALPGITAQASFGPGVVVGEARLRLDVLEQRDWSAAVALDNHGDDATGDQRLLATAAWLNPRGAGDRLTAGVLATVNPANQAYGYLDYDMPLGSRYRLSARIGNNDFEDFEDGATPLDGDGLYFDLAARRNLRYSRERGLTMVLAGAHQRLDWDGVIVPAGSASGADDVDQAVTAVSAGLVGHRIWDVPGVAAEAALNATLGHLGGDRFAGQDATFWLLEADAEAWMPVDMPFLSGEQKLSARLAGQWGNTLLPAPWRFALGGANRSRAFDRSNFLADRGIVLSLEARAPLPIGELLVFTDWGYGDDRAADAQRWRRLGDVGIGWEATLAEGLVSRVSWAEPVATTGSGDYDGDGSRVYWSLRYAY